jgi:hypothetical protein
MGKETFLVCRLISAIAVLTTACGCADHASDKTLSANEIRARRHYAQAPEVLQARVENALTRPPLNLLVVEDRPGFLQTNYRERLGDWHGILFWRKQWQERTSYEITIEPYIDPRVNSGPTTRATYSILTVSADTQQRPNANYEWASFSERDTDRAIEFLRMLNPLISER